MLGIMIFKRVLEDKIKLLFRQFPLLAIVGPRQSGKTTLSKMAFPDLPYVNLEDIEQRAFAIDDPKGFLQQYSQGAILDEVQNTPDLFSYLQVFVDDKNKPSQFVLSGSQNFILNDKIAQSLAGRVAITTLLPLTLKEVDRDTHHLNDIIYNGFYPRLLKHNIAPLDFYSSYTKTYLEKDLRQLQNISNLYQFQKFLKICAGRCGQVLNLTNMANDVGVTEVTVRKWLHLLELSYIIFLLPPYHNNFNKRIIKTPKLYFHDTGLLCYLLGITVSDQINMHFANGQIFENFIISDVNKSLVAKNLTSSLYFWRDNHGYEIDLLYDKEGKLIPIEIKSGSTISQDYFKNINYFNKRAQCDNNFVLYTGESMQQRGNIRVMNGIDFLSAGLY